MLSFRLQRVQQELLAHRLWLRQHTLARNVASPIASASLGRSYATAAEHAGPRKSRRKPRKDARPAESRGKTQDDGYRWKDVPMAYWQKRSGTQDPAAAALEQVLDDAHTFDKAMPLYSNIQDKSIIPKPVLTKLTYNLLLRLKLERAQPEKLRDPEVRNQLHAFAGELVRDIKNGTLQPIPKCNTHLIQFYRENGHIDAAVSFWHWLQKQQPSERYVSSTTYAAIIQTLALKDTPLSEIEELYKEGLAMSPQNFSEYHFSPNAVLSDKTAQLDFILPIPLLEGIMVARVMRGDTRNAYLALDTALRLQPSRTPASFFRGMMDERGVAEAYTLFAIACRAGTPLSSNIFRKLLARLRESTDAMSSPEQFVATLRAMISASYLHVGAGGQLTKNAVTEIIISITQFMRLEAVSALPVEEKRKLAEQVQEVIRKLIACSQRFKALPGLSAFNSIITNLAGFGQSKDVASIALADIDRLGLQPNVVTCRSILTAAGALKHEDMIKEAWKQLVLAVADEAKYPDSTDAYILIKACNNTGVPELARAAIQEMQHLEPHEVERLLEGLDSTQPLQEDTHKADPEAFSHLSSGLDKLTADIEVLSTRTATSLGVQDFSTHSLPMTLTPPPSSFSLPEAEMRKLYDEVTTDPSSPPSPPSASGIQQKSQTGFPLSELRYQNWKTLTYLLAQANQADEEYFDRVERAIAKGERPPGRHAGVIVGEGWGVGLSDTPAKDTAAEIGVEDAREKIRALRGLAGEDVEEIAASDA